MAFKPTPTFNIDRLKSSLANSGVFKIKENAVYQVISQLIDKIGDFHADFDSNKTSIQSQITAITGGGGGSPIPPIPTIVDRTFLTVANETAILPNSRRELAGIYMGLFDDSVANVRTVRGAQWAVLSNGDSVNPEIIFSGLGEAIMIHIP
jgi:hypothetical protein